MVINAVRHDKHGKIEYEFGRFQLTNKTTPFCAGGVLASCAIIHHGARKTIPIDVRLKHVRFGKFISENFIGKRMTAVRAFLRSEFRAFPS